MKIVFKNDDSLNPTTKKWLKAFMLILGLILTIAGLIHLFFFLGKPVGYEKAMTILGENNFWRLPLGIIMLLSYYLLRKSKPEKSDQ